MVTERGVHSLILLLLFASGWRKKGFVAFREVEKKEGVVLTGMASEVLNWNERGKEGLK